MIEHFLSITDHAVDMEWPRHSSTPLNSQKVLPEPLENVARQTSEEARTKANANLLRLCKLLYLLGGFSGATFGRFSTIFYLTVAHLTPHQIGMVEASQPVASAIGNQLFGCVSDRLQRKKAVALASRVVTTALLMLLMVPAVGHVYIHILIVMATMAFFSVGSGVLDAYTLDLLGQERRGEYGRYRLWLAVSWGVGNAIMGLVAQVNFNINFVLFASLSAVSVVIMAAALPARTLGEQKTLRLRREALLGGGGGDEGAKPASSAVQLRRALLRARMFAFLLELGLLGFGFTLVEKFIFVCASPRLKPSHRNPSPRRPAACPSLQTPSTSSAPARRSAATRSRLRSSSRSRSSTMASCFCGASGTT